MIILRDTREKQGWDFEEQEITIADCKLDTGDYTVKGIENELVIERKAGVAEFARNITSPAFKREIRRMAKFPYAFIIFLKEHHLFC